jgi:hypothetical protein
MQLLRRRIGDFYIVRHLGAGGMADVYLAVNPQNREERAIKVMKKRASASASGYARFLREVELIRGLSHPNIVRVIDSGVLEELYYYSMEYMRAGNLARHIACVKSPLHQVMGTFSSICRGMAYAHARGIIHRDLKPANILIGDSGEPRISDFGIAKCLAAPDPSLTKSNEVMGSLAYLSPEQRSGAKGVDRRADVYSLGAVLYEMVMGYPPLGRFPLPCELMPGFPQTVQAILERCLAQKADERFADAGELLDGVDRCRRTLEPGFVCLPSDTTTQAPDTGKADADRIEGWLCTLRAGTTKERLSVIRQMVETMDAREARAILRIYPTEGDRVRWGLIRVFGERQVSGSTSLIMNELKNSFQRECAMEALGKIGAEEAFESIRDLLVQQPNLAITALIPLARTGRQRAIPYLVQFLRHELAVLRESAVHALASVGTDECLSLLQQHVGSEVDERVRMVARMSIGEITSNRAKRSENGEVVLADPRF